MKYLGIDYGKARIGVAVSDEGGRIAFPREVFENESEYASLHRISELVATEKIAEVVMGLPHAMPGVSQDFRDEVKGFSEKLKERAKVRVHFEDELFTTRIAERLSDKKSDAAAAALILQSFLDRQNKVQ